MADAPGKLADALSDHYTIEKEVGAGGMATVYLARDVKHDRQVALKVLRPELAAAMGSERFPREIKFVAQFNHPHILSLYDSGESQGFLYYVMPFVEGESLRDRLVRERQLPINEAVRILREVADALAYAHARGVVHRDIKPGNVLLSGRHAVVADFGVAKAVTAFAGQDTMTTVGVAVGTPQYMSPEQAMAQGEIDQRSDIYALGVMAYEMLAGRGPFAGQTAQAILAAHVLETPKDVREFRPEVPELLAHAVMKCLAKDPADRWQTADELLAELELIAATPSGGMTPTHTRPVHGISAPKSPSRRRLLLGIGAAVILLGGGGGLWTVLHSSGGNTIHRIGVMPIEDISGKDSVFVTALHSALTNALAQLGLVGVAAHSEMMRYKGSPKTIQQIAAELKLDAVVEANVFRAGDIMRISVQFSDPVTTRSLWAAQFNPNVTDVLAAQSTVVNAIKAGIDSVLTGKKTTGVSQ
jgi:eukaryotic-like serine/threonine-protein kinase